MKKSGLPHVPRFIPPKRPAAQRIGRTLGGQLLAEHAREIEERGDSLQALGEFVTAGPKVQVDMDGQVEWVSAARSVPFGAGSMDVFDPDPVSGPDPLLVRVLPGQVTVTSHTIIDLPDPTPPVPSVWDMLDHAEEEEASEPPDNGTQHHGFDPVALAEFDQPDPLDDLGQFVPEPGAGD